MNDALEEEFERAVKSKKDALRRLDKVLLLELKTLKVQSKEVHKVLKLLGMLKGDANFTWEKAQQKLRKNTFKTEILLMDIDAAPRE